MPRLLPAQSRRGSINYQSLIIICYYIRIIVNQMLHNPYTKLRKSISSVAAVSHLAVRASYFFNNKLRVFHRWGNPRYRM